jgi:hypothetical protein
MKYIVFLILVSMFFINDYYLSFYGKGNNLLKTKILYGFNLDFDPLEGHKIEEEQFIQVIGHGTKIDDALTVNKIIKYAVSENFIICEVVDKTNNINIIKITYDENRNIGNKINFQKITNLKFDDRLHWYNLENSKLEMILNFSHFILKVILILSVIIFIYNYINK